MIISFEHKSWASKKTWNFNYLMWLGYYRFQKNSKTKSRRHEDYQRQVDNYTKRQISVIEKIQIFSLAYYFIPKFSQTYEMKR
jgi:hypothetical protein